MSDFSTPVFGEVNHSYMQDIEQLPASGLEALLDNAWAEGVTAIVWMQYTPYFNDGDTCVFGANSEGIYSIQDLDEDTIRQAPRYDVEDYEDYLEEGEENPWQLESEYNYAMVDGSWGRQANDVSRAGAAANAVANAVNSGAYNAVLLKNFGDHAKVVATPNGFYVEYYEHD